MFYLFILWGGEVGGIDGSGGMLRGRGNTDGACGWRVTAGWVTTWV